MSIDRKVDAESTSVCSTERLYRNCLLGYAGKQEQPRVLPKGWYPVSKKPPRPGVYQTSREDIVSFGGARGYWNGRRWEKYEQWGDYSKAPNMVWSHEGAVYGR